MRRFTAEDGTQYVVKIDVPTIKRVRAALQIDLLGILTDKELLMRITSDPILLVDVLYVICESQVLAAEKTDEDFGRSLAGDAIDAAVTAFCEALVDFFPTTRRGLLQTTLAGIKRAESRGAEMLRAKLTDDAVDRLATAELAKAEAEIDRLLSANAGT